MQNKLIFLSLIYMKKGYYSHEKQPLIFNIIETILS